MIILYMQLLRVDLITKIRLRNFGINRFIFLGAIMKQKKYSYRTEIIAADRGGAYVVFPYDLRQEFGRGRVKVNATFDEEPYAGSIVNMGLKNPDGSICYIIGIRKDIREKIGKQPGDLVEVTIEERR